MRDKLDILRDKILNKAMSASELLKMAKFRGQRVEGGFKRHFEIKLKAYNEVLLEINKLQKEK